MRTVILAALTAVTVAGCVSIDNGADQWAARYSKAGVTSGERTNDALDCVPTEAKIMSVLSPAISNALADARKHAACMEAKGYTVTWAPRM